MNKKKILIILSIMCLPILLSTCIDMMTFSLKLNKEKKYNLSCNGNKIQFQVKMTMGTFYRILITPKNSEIDFFPDSLTIIIPPKYKVDNSKYMYEKKEVFEHQKIEKGKTLIFSFSMGGDYGAPDEDPSQVFLIPPGGFIMCDGKPLVTDTIRITL